MANPLPTVGGNSGTWGTVLNAFLTTEHDPATGVHGLASGLVTDVVSTQIDVGGVTHPSPYTIPAPTSAGIHDLTLSASCTFTFPTPTPGQSFTLLIRQGSGGQLITWPANTIVKWDGGVAPTLSTAAAAIDILGFFCVGTIWFGFVSGQDMK
jgi:hypothetical protein